LKTNIKKTSSEAFFYGGKMKGSKKDYQMTDIRIDPTVKKQLRFIAVEREALLADIAGEILLKGA
jgi:hypothetical protein